MESFNYLDFIIKYQLRLAIDYKGTVNDPEYEEIINKYFTLIHSKNKITEEIKIIIEDDEIESLKRTRSGDDGFISKRKIDKLIDLDSQNKKRINERLVTFEEESIAENSSEEDLIRENSIEEELIAENSSEEPNAENYYSNTNYQSKSIPFLKQLEGGGFGQIESVKEAFKIIYEDIKTIPEKYTFFGEGSEEYNKVIDFINKIESHNILVMNKSLQLLKDPASNVSKEEIISFSIKNLVTLEYFNNLIANLSFKLPTLTPNSVIYKKILNYIYLCVKLFDSNILKRYEKKISYSFNNSIVPYGAEIDDGDLKMASFKGSCSHISSLLSIALELENDKLLKDFIHNELKETFKYEINVDNMTRHSLISLSELLLNKGNLNIYHPGELITYNKLYNKIIFYRSFNKNDIDNLITNEKNFIISAKYKSSLIEIGQKSYNIDYSITFYKNISELSMYLIPGNKNKDKLICYFLNKEIDTENLIINKKSGVLERVLVKNSTQQAPKYAFNFNEDFVLGCHKHAILMHIHDREKKEYKIIDPNWNSRNQYNRIFKIEQIVINEGVYYYITDDESKSNLNSLINQIDNVENLDSFILNHKHFYIKPMTFEYGKLKNKLTPIEFSLNQIHNEGKNVKFRDNKFYIGNGIWLNNQGICLTLYNNMFEPFFEDNDILEFKDLLKSDYPISFSEDEINEINTKIKSLNGVGDSKSSGGLFKNHYNLNKYLILILILIVVIIVVIIVILVVNKNKNDIVENYNKNNIKY